MEKEEAITAEEIVQKLAEWSKKYPRGRVYPMSKQSMDDELIEIENLAKSFVPVKSPYPKMNPEQFLDSHPNIGIYNTEHEREEYTKDEVLKLLSHYNPVSEYPKMMMVWDEDESKAKPKEVIAFSKGVYIGWVRNSLYHWLYAKDI